MRLAKRDVVVADGIAKDQGALRAVAYLITLVAGRVPWRCIRGDSWQHLLPVVKQRYAVLIRFHPAFVPDVKS